MSMYVDFCFNNHIFFYLIIRVKCMIVFGLHKSIGRFANQYSSASYRLVFHSFIIYLPCIFTSINYCHKYINNSETIRKLNLSSKLKTINNL